MFQPYQHQQQRQHPVGQGYPLWYRENVVASAQQMTIRETAQLHGCSASTVNRYNRLVENNGSVERQPRRGGQPHKLLPEEVIALLWAVLNIPSLSLEELKTIVEAASNRDIEVSVSLISRELDNIGMSRKQLQYFSMNRDEADRVAFWVNPPDHAVRPGIFGVPHGRIVDLDESGFKTSDASRVYGHSFVGVAAKARGRPPRDGAPSLTTLVAVDTNVGVVQHWNYVGGTTNHRFFMFIVAFLLPAIRHTGPRVITMDNLTAHYFPQTIQAIQQEGHTVIFRPIHSPDFGPIEWVFALLSGFLKRNDFHVNEHNLHMAIEAGLAAIGPDYIAGFFADAHFLVPGRVYRPYMGNN